MDNLLKDAASATPDPERSLKNLSSFLEEYPSRYEELEVQVRSISMLFGCSQFLANYCISNPDILFRTLRDLDTALDREMLTCSLAEALAVWGDKTRANSQKLMTATREFRMREILRITLRDILKKIDLVDVMAELSILADVIIENSLGIVTGFLREIYGAPPEEAFTVLSFGKLGGEELNFSSDVDLMYIYGSDEGETSGVRTAQGVVTNRISCHEYYCKAGEELTRFLSQNTESGLAYRVDLRLRPEGQKGAIALSLGGYEMYYESWGRAWERAVLLRARPVAGDRRLGNDFAEMIKPFVYRKYLDFSSIDEIRKMKTRIDATFKKGDIKRGYGGIREIEFFAQAIQLIYGGREPLVRERNLLKGLHKLLQKALIGQEDYAVLTDNYRYFRTLEHRLQQLNDLQTHTLPSGASELEALSKKMGCQDRKAFTSDLEKRRGRVRNIYDSLFTEKEVEQISDGRLFDEELTDSELREYLAKTSLKDVEKAVRNIKAVKDSTFAFQTLRGRRLLSEILPVFVDSALKSGDADNVLHYLQYFAGLLSSNESYLEIFSKDRSLIHMLTYVFSQSEYLSKMLMTRPQYLEMIGWQEARRKSLALLISELKDSISAGYAVNDAIRLVRKTEEIRLGLMFLQKKTGVPGVVDGLSKTAEAILSAALGSICGDSGLAVIGLGKLGGREITFNSDLDIIFASAGDVEQTFTKDAERLLRMLISYTREGIAYRVDTRLRPEGSKGPLVSSLSAFRQYYAKAAAFWEFQALLKARPVAGDIETGRRFMQMAWDTLSSQGHKVSASDIRQMRDRIMRELSKEAVGYDIKLGPGGIEDIEFMVQFLQLKHCGKSRKILVQSTLAAIHRLSVSGIVSQAEGTLMTEAYLFMRTLETFLRLRGEGVLKKDDASLGSAAWFMGFESLVEFTVRLEVMREKIKGLSEECLRNS
ncbi:MAG: bifunctional [glutamate--ammonia ligase]-adenylyl-L-tyrosine phosphorylase/[glutamate--ammonia-ligase] adenylyltransferase [Nitrospirae bacterium]|nr:bifunctional [glutamate--ammonia ligase]-adenylyl-L-tyrosine phosphorylase/[glutamate--ammonia-ligase] adenylyltransferase [Nitrospirota bacterium]